MKQWIAAFAATGILAFSLNFLQAADMLYFTSSPSSWVGQGQTLTLTSPTTSFSTFRYHDAGVYTDAVELLAGGPGGYTLYLVGPNYTLPTVGFYPNATRWPFMGSGAGLSFSALIRGDNTLTGSFNILQADYDPNGNIVDFAVDFTQYDEGVASSWVKGSFRYNSTIPVPEPAALPLMILLLFGLLLNRPGKNSTDAR